MKDRNVIQRINLWLSGFISLKNKRFSFQVLQNRSETRERTEFIWDKVNKNTNKKISNNEPLERRTEFERTRERIETAASSKEKETVRRR